MSIAVLREMFDQMVVNKDATAIERFYDRSFVMFSNGVIQDYDGFAESHRGVYATEVSYSVEYDEQAWVKTEGKVAGRVWITTSRPDGGAHPHRGGPHRRVRGGSHHPGVGDDVAELQRAARLPDLLNPPPVATGPVSRSNRR